MSKGKSIQKALDIGGDLIQEIGPIRALKKVWDTVVEKRMESLFRECAKKISEGGSGEEFVEKLDKYSSSEAGQEVVYSLVNNALQSESAWCCRALGLMLGTKMNDRKPLTHSERTMSKALKEISDKELRLLVDVVNHYPSIPIPEKIIKDANGDQAKISKDWAASAISIRDYHDFGFISGDAYEHAEMIQHLKSLQVLTDSTSSYGWAVKSTYGLLKLTSISKQLAVLAEKVK